jgi:uncharacterized membrane protein YgaE (UPF0421/DUF939 family)
LNDYETNKLENEEIMKNTSKKMTKKVTRNNEMKKRDKITLKRQCDIGSPFFITINNLKVNVNHIISVEAYNTDKNIVFAVHLSDKRRLEECYQIGTRATDAMFWLAEKHHQALTKETDDICNKQKKPLEQIEQRDVRVALQELIDLRRQRLNSSGSVLPATFRGITPSKNKWILFEAKNMDEFYISVQDDCVSQPIPEGEGQELLFSILEHMKPRIGWSDMIWEKVIS